MNNTEQNSLCDWATARQFSDECIAISGLDSLMIFSYMDKVSKLESPLEILMFAAITAAAATATARVTGCDIDVAVPIGRYRADIVIRSTFLSTLVVECDGHSFHDRTRDQAMRDRQRDRYMLARGVLVARFTGQEIIEAPFGCAAEALSIHSQGTAVFSADALRAEPWPIIVRRSSMYSEELTGGSNG
jgi:very-short-patch-repair endonuclease